MRVQTVLSGHNITREDPSLCPLSYPFVTLNVLDPILFNFYMSGQELPIKNPITKVEAFTAEASELHLPFSNAQPSSIQETLLAKGDKQWLLFISFIYYAYARPAEEVRLL